ncbi:MAG: CDP-alcohol phosphatidyltransferase family protein [Candidatus Omnitrophica bacterium]|nr:CDP-alcohol phosphatidyltransferase family protein [Candidatus Omnitrophota bacterium]
MLRNLVYTRVEPILTRSAQFCSERKLSPNQLTLAGLAVNFLAGWAYSGGLFILGGVLVLAASLGDLLDGPLARLTGKASRFGAFLDSTVDRYSDFFLFGGVTYYFAQEESWGWCLAGLGILLGTFVTSYAKARAESLMGSCPVGIFERPERILILLIGSFIPPLFGWALAILLIGTHVTALQRIFFVRRSLS